MSGASSQSVRVQLREPVPFTQTMPTVPPTNLPGMPFQWRSREGVFHRIDQMKTRHLFYAVRMIWNHSMPENARSQSYIKYDFSPFYTEDYMRRALSAMCPELLQRTDLTPFQKAEIDRWRAYFCNRGLMLEKFCTCGQCLPCEVSRP